MGTWNIDYSLPTTAIRISGNATVATDKVGGPRGEELVTRTAEATAEPIVIAARSTDAACQVAVKHGLLFQVSTNLAFTSDGRLTSASADSGGEVRELVSGVLTLGGAVASTLIAFAAQSLTIARHATDTRTATERAPADPVHARYAASHPIEAGLMVKYAQAVVALEDKLAGVILGTAGPTLDQNSLIETRRIETALTVARSHLARLTEQFQAWRASQVTSRQASYEYVIPIDELRDRVEFHPATKQLAVKSETLRQAWDTLGLVVELVDPAPAQAPQPPIPATMRGIWIRVPRRVQLRTWRRDLASDTAELVDRTSRLIVDEYSTLRKIEFKSSMWSRRTVAVTLTPEGGIASYEYAGEAAATAIGQALGDVPSKVSDGITQAVTAREKLAAPAAEKADKPAEPHRDELELVNLLAIEDFAKIGGIERIETPVGSRHR
jgi:hypothetical protein